VNDFSSLTEAHFESQVARAVYNDKGQQAANPMIRRAEMLLVQWMDRATPRQVLLVAARIDRHLFLHMSPRMMRRFSFLVCDLAPQVLPQMPNMAVHVQALSRAIHMSKFLHPAALGRIVGALEKEGLTVSKKNGGAHE
jgi:hypothetical protein